MCANKKTRIVVDEEGRFMDNSRSSQAGMAELVDALDSKSSF